MQTPSILHSLANSSSKHHLYFTVWQTVHPNTIYTSQSGKQFIQTPSILHSLANSSSKQHLYFTVWQTVHPNTIYTSQSGKQFIQTPSTLHSLANSSSKHHLHFSALHSLMLKLLCKDKSFTNESITVYSQVLLT